MVKKLLCLSLALLAGGLFVGHNFYAAEEKENKEKQEQLLREEQKAKRQKERAARQEAGSVLSEIGIPDVLAGIIGEYADEKEDAYEVYDSSDVKDVVSNMSFSSDGTYAAFGLKRATTCSVCVYDMTLQQIVNTVELPSASIDQIVFIPKSDVIACLSQNSRRVELWDYRKGEHITMLIHSAPILSIFYNLQKNTLMFVDETGSIFEWVRQKEGNMWADERPTNIRQEKGFFETGVFSLDGSCVAMVARNSNHSSDVTWYEIAQKDGPRFTSHFAFNVNRLSFSFDNKLLALGSRNFSKRIWLVDATKNEPAIPTLQTDSREPVVDLSFSPKQLLLISVGADGTAKLWGKEGPKKQWENIGIFESPYSDKMARAVAFSPDGKLFAVAVGAHINIWRKRKSGSIKEGFDLKKNIQDGMGKVERLHWLRNNPTRYNQAAKELIKEGKLNALQYRCATMQAIDMLKKEDDKKVLERLKEVYPEYFSESAIGK